MHRQRPRRGRRPGSGRHRLGRLGRFGVEGEGARQRQRRQAPPSHQAGLGRPHEQHAVAAREALEQRHRPLLRGGVEIDQQVAAEHEVIGQHVRQQMRIEQIARQEAHPRHHHVGQLMAVGGLGEIAVAVRQVVAAERIAAITGAPGELDHALADVHRVDLEASGRHPGIEQRHGDGIRLLAAGTGHAQHPQHARLGARREQALARQRGHRRLRFRIAEEPGLRHDHRLDQLLHLGRRGLQQRQVILLVVAARRLHAVAHRALDRGAADGAAVQPHLALERRAEVIHPCHARAPSSDAIAAGNSSARTASGNRSATLTACTMPRPSLSTGPR
ncbi:hypothetical protein LMG26845_05946 [Achromobacter insuavis]|uniref:Uncharacterized protein n=1 Tax=Achromobacter insuavis TaxID=1287735 RepID=A0A6J5BQ97_9BURK|nr:hypothetical protein LMG26845_05946 [Achromobacter insuavis]